MARRQPVFFRKVQSALKYVLLAASLTLLILVGHSGFGMMPLLSNLPSSSPVLAQNPVINASNPALTDALQLMEQGREYYEKGQFSEAVRVWQQAASTFTTLGDETQEARVLSYLSLALQQLGEWQQAEEAIGKAMTMLQMYPTVQTLHADSLNQLQTREILRGSKERLLIFAQVLNTQGHLQLSMGKAEEALKTWKQASIAYTRSADQTGMIGSLINQAQALQALGLFRQALNTLSQAYISLEDQPNSLLKFNALRNLGDLLRVTGSSNNLDPSWLALQKSLGLENLKNLEQSEKVLYQSLAIAQNLPSSKAIGEAWFSLGNWATNSSNRQRSLYERTRLSQRDLDPTLKPTLEEARKALNYYQKAIDTSNLATNKIRAKLNQLSFSLEIEAWLLKIEQWSEAETWWLKKIQPQLIDLPTLQTQITNLPSSLTGINAQINFAQIQVRFKQIQEQVAQNSSLLTQISKLPFWSEIDQLMKKTIQETENFIQLAKDLEDQRTESYSVGIVGKLYEQLKDFSKAPEMTAQALQISQSIQSWDIAYQWQWQLGRIRKAQGRIEGESGAIEAYNAAVNTLQTIRQDLAVLNPDIQFSFRDDIEPVYRELIDLLLQSKNPSQPNLIRAREVFASLQLAELENFLREACSPSSPELLDTIVDENDPGAAVIYAIILKNRLEVILKLPKQQELQHHVTDVPQNQVEEIVDQLRQKLIEPQRFDKYTQEIKDSSTPLYSWLIQPFESQLKASGVKTLVFVLDGVLQNIPMSVISNGNKYLIEDYAVVFNREPQLLNPKPFLKEKLEILAFGLSQLNPLNPDHQEFNPLDDVDNELENIPYAVKLLNEKFTNTALQNRINSRPFSIVHLATHGKFSSEAEETFILTWDQRVKVNELSSLLRSRDQSQPDPIELLVLSACQTAEGDNRATLGLAGVSVRAGARSTLATLWSVRDEPTTYFISQLYKKLSNPQLILSKAEVIQQIQKEFIASSKFKHPYYWSAFVLLGNWLSLFPN